MPHAPAFAVACGLAAVHLLSRRLTFLDRLPRSRWLSVAGGVAVAYAVVHLLPELAEIHDALAAEAGAAGAWAAEHGGYLVALAGLVCFYGLERLAARTGRRTGEDETHPPPAVFWLHVGSYALYNLLFGALLTEREDASWRNLTLFACAIGLHFVVNDRGLRAHHPVLYPRFGRWLVAAAPPLGWAIGAFAPLPAVVSEGVIGFLIGGVLLNTFKEELPPERQSRFPAFAAGCAAYAAVLAAV